MFIKYRAIKENGYVEFLSLEEAQSFSQNVETVECFDDEISIENENKKKLKELEKIRYEKEVGGIEIGNTSIQTDRESRANIMGALILAKDDPQYSVVWKSKNGFVHLSSENIIAIANAVADHVKKCFLAESLVSENISNVEDLNYSFNQAYGE